MLICGMRLTDRMTQFTFTSGTEEEQDGIETEQNIPDGMKVRSQWLCYRKEYNAEKDKYDKIPKAPYWTVDGDTHVKNIGVRSENEWTTYEKASAFVDETQQKCDSDEALDGVGFVLTEDDPYVFLDLDDHIVNGELTDLADEWLTALDSWSEVSQSSEGLHCFVEAEDFTFDGLKKRDDSQGIELYADARFAAVTGDTIPDYGNVVRERTDALTEIAHDYLEKEHDESEMEPIQPDWDCDSEKDADAAIKTACAYDDEFDILHNGGTVNHDTSHDDISYLTKCFFWAKGDEALVREMAQKSSRPRQKWREARSGGSWFDNRVAEARNYQDETFNGDYI